MKKCFCHGICPGLNIFGFPLGGWLGLRCGDRFGYRGPTPAVRDWEVGVGLAVLLNPGPIFHTILDVQYPRA